MYPVLRNNATKNMKTAIVLPTYNESQNIEGMIAALLALEIGQTNVLVVDDNSPVEYDQPLFLVDPS